MAISHNILCTCWRQVGSRGSSEARCYSSGTLKKFAEENIGCALKITNAQSYSVPLQLRAFPVHLPLHLHFWLQKADYYVDKVNKPLLQDNFTFSHLADDMENSHVRMLQLKAGILKCRMGCTLQIYGPESVYTQGFSCTKAKRIRWGCERLSCTWARHASFQCRSVHQRYVVCVLEGLPGT